MATYCTDDSDSVVELPSEYSPISSPTSISTENGNKYNNQLHYYEVHGWPDSDWQENGPLAQTLKDIYESGGDAEASPTSYRLTMGTKPFEPES